MPYKGLETSWLGEVPGPSGEAKIREKRPPLRSSKATRAAPASLSEGLSYEDLIEASMKSAASQNRLKTIPKGPVISVVSCRLVKGLIIIYKAL